MRAFLLFVLAFLTPVLLLADDNKDWREAMQIIIQVLDRGKVTETEIPGLLLDDEVAKTYCMNILNISDEQYSRDTARVNAVICDAQWITEHQILPDDGMSKKLAKKKYDTGKLDEIYCWAENVLHSVYPRYGILTDFCDRQLRLRREALQKTMPGGKLISFYYREYGSSRPDEVIYELRSDISTGHWQLNGREVADTVAYKVRELAERGKAYQCLSHYMESPHFQDAPHTLGGLPSWQFCCKFEGGEINSESECEPVPANFCAILNYLKSLNY